MMLLMGALFILNYKRMKEKWQVVILLTAVNISVRYMLALQRLQQELSYPNAMCSISKANSNYKKPISICIFSHE